MAKLPKLKNTMLPFPRMIMEAPKEGAVKPIMKMPLGVQKKSKMPKALSSKPLKISKLPMQGEISTIHKSLLPKVIKVGTSKAVTGKVRSGMKGITSTGKVRIPSAGKVGTQPTTVLRTGGERIGHKYIRREAKPAGGYRYWYRSPVTGKEVSEKQYRQELKQVKEKKVAPPKVKEPKVKPKAEVKPKVEIKPKAKVKPAKLPEKVKIKPAELPKKAEVKPIKPAEFPKKVEDVTSKQAEAYTGLSDEHKEKLSSNLNAAKKAVDKEAEFNPDPEIAALQKQLDSIIYVLEKLATFDPKELREKAKIGKFSSQNIETLHDISDVQSLLVEAKDVDNPQPEHVVKKLEKQLDYIARLNSERQAQEIKEKNKAYIAQQTNPENLLNRKDVKSKELSYSGNIKKDNQANTDKYAEYLINRDRKQKGEDSIDYDDYKKQMNKNMLNILKSFGVKNPQKDKDIKIDAINGMITFKGSKYNPLINEMRRFERESEETSFNSSTERTKGVPVTTLKFSRIGNQVVFKPITNSVLNVTKNVRDAVNKEPGSVYRAFGDSVEKFDDESGNYVRSIVATKGTGKTQLLEGSVAASILGNIKGTYKAVVVDPDNSLFKELYTDDSKLSSEQKKYKDMVNGWIKDGRLTLISPRTILNESSLNDKNYKKFIESVNEKLVTEGEIQTTNYDKNQSSMQAKDVYLDEFGKMLKYAKNDRGLYRTFTSTTTDIGKSKSRKGLMRITTVNQTPEKDDAIALGNDVQSTIALGSGISDSAFRGAFGTGAGTARALKGVAGSDAADVKDPENPKFFNQMVVGKSKYKLTNFTE